MLNLIIPEFDISHSISPIGWWKVNEHIEYGHVLEIAFSIQGKHDEFRFRAIKNGPSIDRNGYSSVAVRNYATIYVDNISIGFSGKTRREKFLAYKRWMNVDDDRIRFLGMTNDSIVCELSSIQFLG